MKIFKRLSTLAIIAFATLTLGCTALRPKLATPNASVIIPVHVHVINKFDKNYTAVDMVNRMNKTLKGFVGVNATITIDKKMPMSTWERGELVPVPGVLNVYIQHSVDGADETEPPRMVRGMVVDTQNACDVYILISSKKALDDTLLHELGHVMGLKHVEDISNVMDSGRNWSARLTHDQLETMRRQAIQFSNKCL